MKLKLALKEYVVLKEIHSNPAIMGVVSVTQGKV